MAAQDKDGYNCLNDACYYGHLSLIEFFFNHWPKEESGEYPRPGGASNPRKKSTGYGHGSLAMLDCSSSSV